MRNMIPKNINCIYIRQAEAWGSGHAVLCAKPVIGDEPFAVPCWPMTCSTARRPS